MERKTILSAILLGEYTTYSLICKVFLWVVWNEYILSGIGAILLSYFCSKYFKQVFGGADQVFISPAKFNSSELQKQVKMIKDK